MWIVVKSNEEPNRRIATFSEPQMFHSKEHS